MGNKNLPYFIDFRENGVIISLGWSLSISHEDMKRYIHRYYSADKPTHLDPGNGFHKDPNDTQLNIKNGILCHNDAKLSFYGDEFKTVINWLSNQYGKEV